MKRLPARIRIAGSSGSGKTYLGELLSARIGVPVTSLDAITFDFSKTHRFDVPRSEIEKHRMVRAVVKRKTWLIEGGYFEQFKYSYDAADVILIVHPSFSKRTWNVILRFFRRIAAGKYEGFGNFVGLLRYNVRTRTKWDDRIALFHQLYGSRVHVFSDANEAYDWFIRTYGVT